MYNNLIGNRGGVPFVTATQTNAGSSSTNAVYTLPNHTFRFLGPAGLMVITIPAASASTVTGITVSVNENTLAITDNEGDALTTLNQGDYLVAFNKITNTLKVL